MNHFLFKLITFLLFFCSVFLNGSFALSNQSNVDSKLPEPDEHSYRGEEVDLYLASIPALVVMIPSTTPNDIRASIEKEVAILTDSIPDAQKDVFIIEIIDHGVVELDEYDDRYIFEVDKQGQAKILMTEGYSDIESRFVNYSGDYSIINELKTYFEVEDIDQFKAYVDKRERLANSNERGEKKRRLQIMLDGITTDILPTLTLEETKSVNRAITPWGNMLLKNVVDEYYFDKPFRELEVAFNGSYKGIDGVMYRNVDQQQTFNHVKVSSDHDIYMSNYYHASGLLISSKEKNRDRGHDRTDHIKHYVFWQSDYIVNVYSVDFRSTSLRSLEYIRVMQHTFDDDYRLIKTQSMDYDIDKNKSSNTQVSEVTTYYEDGGRRVETIHSGNLLYSNTYNFANGKFDYLEIVNNYGNQTVSLKYNVAILADEQGKELKRIEFIFDEEGYLKEEKSTSELTGDSTIHYSYKK